MTKYRQSMRSYEVLNSKHKLNNTLDQLKTTFSK